MDYTAHFYSWAGSLNGTVPSISCTAGTPDARCTRLGQQVLARLIEERVILSYAKQHHIALSRGDRARAERQLRRLTMSDAPTNTLFSRNGVERAFMKSVLERELLVRKVEAAVAPSSTREGPAFHVEKFAIPLLPGRASSEAYREALDLATDGKPIPPAAEARIEWLAPFRLPPEERRALQAAGPGQYVGPFAHKRAYLVMQLIGKSNHAYGRPAKLLLEADYFRSWLRDQIRRTDPQCFDRSGAPVKCPTGTLESKVATE